jgi:hypothetical protein
VNARLALLGLSAAAALALSACASHAPSPEDPFKAASSALERAEYARADDYASPEMHGARDKLSAARQLSQRAAQTNNPQDKQQAAWLAQEADADAELAMAKAEKVRAENALRQQGGQP